MVKVVSVLTDILFLFLCYGSMFIYCIIFNRPAARAVEKSSANESLRQDSARGNEGSLPYQASLDQIQTVPDQTNSDDADQLLEQAEAALKLSEELTKAELGVDLDKTVNGLLNESFDMLEHFLSTGNGEFDSETFLSSLFESVQQKEIIDVMGQKPVPPAVPSKPILSSAAQMVADASASLITQFNRLYEEKKKKDNMRLTEDMLYPQKYAAFQKFGGYNLKRVSEIAKEKAIGSSVPHKYVDKTTAERTSYTPHPRPAHIDRVKRQILDDIDASPLDLSPGKWKIPLYLDGTQDSKSDSSISSGILASSPSSSPTQPQTPPVAVSENESEQRSFELLEVSCSDGIQKEGTDGGQRDESDVSSVSNFSTLSTSTHGTFASDSEIMDPTYANHAETESKNREEKNEPSGESISVWSDGEQDGNKICQ